MKAESKCFIYYFTVHSEKCINSLAILCINGSTGEKKQHSAASSHHLITATHKNHVLLHLTLMGSDFLQNVDRKVCMHCPPGGFTTLLKVAVRHVRLAVSTFAGPAEERDKVRNEGRRSRRTTLGRK